MNCLDENGDPIEIEGLLTQQLNVQYQQPITRLYEVGTQRTFYVAGRPQGNANVARVLGPGNVMAEFYECLGNVCNADLNDICFCVQSGCNSQVAQQFGAMNICLKNVVLQSLGVSIRAEDMIINEQLSLFFTAMLVENEDEGCVCTGAQEVTCNCFTS